MTEEQLKAYQRLEEAIQHLDTVYTDSGDLLADYIVIAAWHTTDGNSSVGTYTRPNTPPYRALGLLRAQVARHEGAIANE